MLDVRLRALGCRVVRVATGRDTLAAIHQERPAVMLVDVGLPDMTGVEVLQRLKREGIAVITLVTFNNSRAEMARAAVAEGARAAFEKPFDLHEVELVVRMALEDTSSGEA